MTRKGFGYDPAEQHEADQFHRPGPFNVETGEENPKGQIWTDVFADEIVTLGAERQDLVAITAAMMHPVGLHRFAARVPRAHLRRRHRRAARRRRRPPAWRWAGMHPVVAVYATFLNRAFDQVLMDVALHRCGVTFVLDRSGVTGDDGASPQRHVGHVDPAGRARACGSPPRATAPGCASCCARPSQVDDAPTVVRFPKGPPPADVEAVGRAGGCDVLVRSGARDVLIVGVGSMAVTAVEVAERLVAQGIGVTVVDPRWVKPVDPALLDLAREHRLVVSVEDNGIVGGCGSVLLQTLNAAASRRRCGCTASRRSSSTTPSAA